MSSYGCQQVLINPSSELEAVLEFVCSESNKLANCGIYYARQLYFKTGRIPGRAELHRLLKTNMHFKALYSHVAQQTLTSVAESFSSFIGLLKAVALGNVDQRPKLPNYKKNSLKLVTFPRADVKLKDGEARLVRSGGNQSAGVGGSTTFSFGQQSQDLVWVRRFLLTHAIKPGLQETQRDSYFA